MKSYRKDRSDAPAPLGAIQKREEIIELVIEARKEKKAIRVWTVTQSGHLSCFYITSKSRLHKADTAGQWKVDCYHDHSLIGMKQTNDRWFKHYELMGSYNIESCGGNCHFAFTSRIAAKRYSEELKNDNDYIQSVKEWHDRCDRMFRDVF